MKKSVKGIDISIISLLGLVLIILGSYLSETFNMEWLDTVVAPVAVFGTIIAILLYLRNSQ